jgi:hypothetical protein
MEDSNIVLSCSDAFQRREKASEDYAIRQREKEKLIELKKKLQEQQQHLDRLSKHMYDTQLLARCSSIPIESTANLDSFSDEITKEQSSEQK